MNVHADSKAHKRSLISTTIHLSPFSTADTADGQACLGTILGHLRECRHLASSLRLPRLFCPVPTSALYGAIPEPEALSSRLPPNWCIAPTGNVYRCIAEYGVSGTAAITAAIYWLTVNEQVE